MAWIQVESDEDFLLESGATLTLENDDGSGGEPSPPVRRPKMHMVKFSPTMYPDDVVFFRASRVTSSQGGSSFTYPDAGIPMTANVQSKRIDRSTPGGRTISVTIHTVTTPTDIQAKPDDKFEWIGRKLIVEAGTIPKGTGNVTFHTPCVESK